MLKIAKTKYSDMRKVVVLAALFSFIFVHAQDIELVQKEIDQTLWKPFKEAFENLDAEKLNLLYAVKVLRVTPGGIDTENSFKNANFERLNGHKKSNTTLQLDFWFDSRHTNANASYDVGFYRMVLTNTNGVNIIYGQFHIVLKKTNGTWKITQDWDTSSINGKDISITDFERQKPIQFD